MHAVRGSSLFRLRLKVLQSAVRAENQMWLCNARRENGSWLVASTRILYRTSKENRGNINAENHGEAMLPMRVKPQQIVEYI